MRACPAALTRSGFDRPPEGIDRADREDLASPIPARRAQELLAPGGRRRPEGPGGVGAPGGADPEVAEDPARGIVAADHQAARALALDEAAQGGVHLPGLGAVAHAELLLGGGHAQGAGHHRRQRAGELRLEHRPFAGDHPVVTRTLLEQELRKDLGDRHLAAAAEVARRELLVDRGHGERGLIVAEEMVELTAELLDPHVGAGVAGAVVAGEEEAQRLTGLPLARGEAQGVAPGADLDQAGDRPLERAVGIEGAGQRASEFLERLEHRAILGYAAAAAGAGGSPASGQGR